MDYLPRTAIRWFITISFLFSGLFAQNLPALERTREALYQNNGKLIELEIVHQQYNQDWIETATMDIVGPGQYLLDMKDQLVKVSQTSIYTWNKATDQVLIDLIAEDDITIWDILTGDFQQLGILEEIQTADNIKIKFDYPALGLTGTLTVDTATSLPRNITLSYGANDTILLNIIKIEDLGVDSQFNTTEFIDKEIIDLRE